LKFDLDHVGNEGAEAGQWEELAEQDDEAELHNQLHVVFKNVRLLIKEEEVPQSLEVAVLRIEVIFFIIILHFKLEVGAAELSPH